MAIQRMRDIVQKMREFIEAVMKQHIERIRLNAIDDINECFHCLNSAFSVQIKENDKGIVRDRESICIYSKKYEGKLINKEAELPLSMVKSMISSKVNNGEVMIFLFGTVYRKSFI